jgi:hypothetical protein|tara:strand:+ start:4027 stop:4629 length:603 start_codon:yes stop_codon:yes gene_type:complete
MTKSILDGLSWSHVDSNQQGITGPIPEGSYLVEGIEVIERSAQVEGSQPYKSGAQGIDIQFSVVGPSHVNRRIFETFVIVNRDGSENLASLGRLKALAEGVGIDVSMTDIGLQTVMASMNRPCPVHIVIEPGAPDGKGGLYPDKNRISTFNYKGGDQPQPQPQPQAPVAQPAPQAVAPQAQPQAAAPQAQTGPAINWSKP